MLKKMQCLCKTDYCPVFQFNYLPQQMWQLTVKDSKTLKSVYVHISSLEQEMKLSSDKKVMNQKHLLNYNSLSKKYYEMI